MAGVQEQLDEGPGYRFMFYEEFDPSYMDQLMMDMLGELARETGLDEVALIGGKISTSRGRETGKWILDQALAV